MNFRLILSKTKQKELNSKEVNDDGALYNCSVYGIMRSGRYKRSIVDFFNVVADGIDSRRIEYYRT